MSNDKAEATYHGGVNKTVKRPPNQGRIVMTFEVELPPDRMKANVDAVDIMRNAMRDSDVDGQTFDEAVEAFRNALNSYFCEMTGKDHELIMSLKVEVTK